jgi:hypothetical protein
MLARSFVFVAFWLAVLVNCGDAQQIEGVIENSKLPTNKRISPDDGAIRVDWDTPIEQKNSTSSLPDYVSKTYIINQTGHPIQIRRTSESFDSNLAIEFKNEQNIWQRITPQNQQFHLCGTGLSTTEFQLTSGKSFVEPLHLQKYGGKKHMVRIRICVGGKNYYSPPRELEINIDPANAERSENDDWSIAYGSIARLESIIRGDVTISREHHFSGMMSPRALAIQSLGKPWHDRDRVTKILDAITNSKDSEHYDLARKIRANLEQTKR